MIRPTIPRKRIRDFSPGLQDRTADNIGTPIIHALNADFDQRVGGIVGRKGSLVLTTPAGYRILNLFTYKYGATQKYIAVIDNTTNTVIYVSSTDFTGSWSSVKSLTTGKDVFLENFIGKMFYFNGVDTPQYWDGTTLTNVTNAPAAGKFPFVLNQRLFVLTESGYLWYSDVVGSDGISFTSTTWLNRGINPNDGQKCTYAVRHRGRGILFKTESIYRYDGTNEPEAIITIGTHSWRSVVAQNARLYFHHPSGIYEMEVEPSLISRPVEKFLKGMSSANWVNVASMKDQYNVYFWIGDVTINDITAFDYGKSYTDVVLVFNVFSRRWTVFSGWNIRMGFYDDLTGDSFFGRASGKIVKANTGYSDIDGATVTAIPMEIIFRPDNFDYPEKEKSVGQIFLSGRLQGLLSASDNCQNLDSDLAQVGNMEKGIAEICTGVQGKEIWVAYRESYVDAPPYIKELIFDKIDVYDEAK